MADSKRWQDYTEPGVRKGGFVYTLLGDLSMATRITKAAKLCHVEIHNFDKAAPILSHFEQQVPVLVIVDWDAREAEGYNLLSGLAKNADYKKVPFIGFVSQAKAVLKREAQRAGCDRVYSKAEFIRELNNIFMRYAL